MAKTPEDRPPNVPYTINFKCHKCGQEGFAVWEEYCSPGKPQGRTSLVSVSDGFYERLNKRGSALIELVCNRCEAVQPD
jgi:hypothetical protein